MQSILIQAADCGNNQMFNPQVRDGCNDPYIYLRERLLALDFDLKTADAHSLKDCAGAWFWDGGSITGRWGVKGFARKVKGLLMGRGLKRDLYAECLQGGLGERVALFLWEAPGVSPANWDPRLHAMFPVIFTWHDAYVDGRKFHKIHCPQTRQFPVVPKIPFGQKKLLVNISVNKISKHSRELYSARRTTIRHFEQNRPADFDLYGFGWEARSYPSYRGSVRHKWEVLPQYRFSVCYENLRDEPGYVTEKIFDSMRARCVPVYWGAPNIGDYVDEGAFIERRRFQSNAELEDYLTGITEKDYEDFQAAMEAYLVSERFARFLPAAFADTVIRVLQL